MGEGSAKTCYPLKGTLLVWTVILNSMPSTVQVMTAGGPKSPMPVIRTRIPVSSNSTSWHASSWSLVHWGVDLQVEGVSSTVSSSCSPSRRVRSSRTEPYWVLTTTAVAVGELVSSSTVTVNSYFASSTVTVTVTVPLATPVTL